MNFNDGRPVLNPLKLSRSECLRTDVNYDILSSPTALLFAMPFIHVYTNPRWWPLGRKCKRQLYKNFFDHRW